MNGVVIARHRRNVDFKSKFCDVEVFVYDKENPSNPYNVPLNKGSEASVYLKFIVDHYERLPEYTFFIHDSEHSWHHDGSIVDKYDEAIASNNQYVNVNNHSCMMRKDSISKCQYEKLLEWYCKYIEKYIPIELVPNNYDGFVDGHAGCAQFLVHRDLILNFPKSMYQDIYNWIIEEDVVLPKECECNQNIISGNFLEWTWHIFFDIYPKVKHILPDKKPRSKAIYIVAWLVKLFKRRRHFVSTPKKTQKNANAFAWLVKYFKSTPKEHSKMNLTKKSTREDLISEMLKLKLFADGRGNIYCQEYEQHLSNSGMWFFPDELADFLIYMRDKKIKSFLNIGTHNGTAFNFMSDYLNIFNSVRCVSLDPIQHDMPIKKDEYEYLTKSSDYFIGQNFDLVFIDGDHSYEGVKKDYENVGKYAKYCAFHDVDDDFIRNNANLNGGVCRFWQEIKGKNGLIFNTDKKTIPIMGIGLLEGAIPPAKAAVVARKSAARNEFDAFLKTATPTIVALSLPQETPLVELAFAEGQGSATRARLAGKETDLPLTASTTWQPGPNGSSAILLDGKAGELANSGDFEHDRAFSTAFWIRVPSNDSSYAVISRMDESNAHRGWDVWVQGRRIAMHLVHSFPEDALKVVAKNQLKPDEWTLVSVTYDGSGKAEGVKIYYDGKLQEKPQVENNKFKKSTIRTEVPLVIGGRSKGATAHAVGLASLSIWGRALSPAEVEGLSRAQVKQNVVGKVVLTARPVQTMKVRPVQSVTGEAALGPIRSNAEINNNPFKRINDRVKSFFSRLFLRKPYKMVVVMPAGRKRYMEVMLPHILKQKGLIDEFRIWCNTKEQSDLDYIEQIASSNLNFITVEHLPPSTDKVGEPWVIHNFFKNTTDPNTIYLRIDDDIVWAEKDFFKKMYEFRIENLKHFLVYGNIVNNAVCDHLCQKNGVYKSEPHYGFDSWDQNGWRDPILAENKHRQLIENIKNNQLEKYRFSPVVLENYQRVSINCICWFGSEFAKFNGMVGLDEEQWLASDKPRELGLPNCIFGEAICSHFSFYSQREHMDKTDILDKYRSLR